jgi:hypothetical protein
MSVADLECDARFRARFARKVSLRQRRSAELAILRIDRPFPFEEDKT